MDSELGIRLEKEIYRQGAILAKMEKVMESLSHTQQQVAVLLQKQSEDAGEKAEIFSRLRSLETSNAVLGSRSERTSRVWDRVLTSVATSLLLGVIYYMAAQQWSP